MATPAYLSVAELADELTREENLDAIVSLGARAKALLGDETLARAIIDTKAELIRQWGNANTVEDRERLHAEFTAVDAAMKRLATFYQKGQAAADQRAGQ